MEESIGYSRTYYIDILTRNFLRMRGKLLNVADATAQSEEQRRALKGLIKDFTRDCYEGSVAEFTNYLTQIKILPEGVSETMPSLDFEANNHPRTALD